MKNIRKSVFETNSSSSHSIHIDETTELLDNSLIPNDVGELILAGGQFGWEWERFNDAKTKANYASVSDSGVNQKLLIEVLKEQTGAIDVIIKADDDYKSPYHSYIDHESCGLLSQLNTKEKLRNFIFNQNCWLVTGNDNESAPYNLFDFPKNNIPVKYKYEIFIQSVHKLEFPKFSEKPTEKQIRDALYNVLNDKRYTKFGDQNNSQWYSSDDEDFKPFDYHLYDMINENNIVDFNEGTVLAYCSRIMEKEVEKQTNTKFYNFNYQERQEKTKEFYQKDPSKYSIKIKFHVRDI